MTKEHFDELDNKFDVEPQPEDVEIVETTPRKMKKVQESNPKEDQQKDYRYARAQLYDIVEKMQESINDAMDVAHDSQHPRAYEVVFQGAKAAADVVDKLADLQKKMKDLTKEEEQVVASNNTQNNIYMSGSTADLIKMLKETKDK
jgi:hypothetical protein